MQITNRIFITDLKIIEQYNKEGNIIYLLVISSGKFSSYTTIVLNNIDKSKQTEIVKILNNKLRSSLLKTNLFDLTKVDKVIYHLFSNLNKNININHVSLTISLCIYNLVAKITKKSLVNFLHNDIFKLSLRSTTPNLVFKIIKINKIRSNQFNDDILIYLINNNSIKKTLTILNTIMTEFKRIMKHNNQDYLIDSNGLIIVKSNNFDATIDYLEKSILNCKYKVGIDVGLGIDISSDRFKNNKYLKELVNFSKFYWNSYIKDDYGSITKNQNLLNKKTLLIKSFNSDREDKNSFTNNFISFNLANFSTISSIKNFLKTTNNINRKLEFNNFDYFDNLSMDLMISLNCSFCFFDGLFKIDNIEKYNYLLKWESLNNYPIKQKSNFKQLSTRRRSNIN